MCTGMPQSTVNTPPTPNAQRLMPAKQIEQGLALLREACRYRKFNESYWWTLGVELRKAGQYEEALEVYSDVVRAFRNEFG